MVRAFLPTPLDSVILAIFGTCQSVFADVNCCFVGICLEVQHPLRNRENSVLLQQQEMQTGIQFLTNILKGDQAMEAEVLSCVAVCDTNCMDKIFLQLYLKYSTSDRNGAGRIMIQTVSIITQKTPALSHFISPNLFFTVPFLYSDSSRPNVLTSSCSVIWVYFTRRSGDTLCNFTPKMCRGSSHMMPSLRPEISCQLFHAALLWVHGNAQLILSCLCLFHSLQVTPISGNFLL